MLNLTFRSPVGWLTIQQTGNAITKLWWGRGDTNQETPLLTDARRQLLEYFGGKRKQFELPTAPLGTRFQIQVWHFIAQIPYGRTQTYGDLARLIGTSPRPLGAACGANPIPLIIPCHRILGKTGKLVGYSGGLGTETKRFLLSLEERTNSSFEHPNN